MKKNFKKRINASRIISTFTILILFFHINIYAQVTVVLQQPPPYQFNVDYMWKVTLINPTNTTYKIYLTGVATESLQGQIIKATSAAFSLAPGVKIINTHDLIPMKVEATNNRYTSVVKNIGTLPTGNYEICVNVIDAETGMLLGTQCMETQVENLSQVELLQPESNTTFISGNAVKNDAEDIGNSKIITGSFITFSWLPPSPVPPGAKITYSIKIAEIFGDQSPYDALLSNPAFFKNQNIYSNVFLYPTAGRNFENKRKYAWQVIAYLNNEQVSKSEIWAFAYSDNSNQKTIDKKNISVDEKQSSTYSSSQQPLLIASLGYSQLYNMIYDNKNENDFKPFVFSGNVKLSFDAGYKALPFSDLSNNTLTAQLNPSIALYGLPFAANILLSNQQSSNRQSLNSASFGFDIDSYKEQIKSRLEKKITETVTGWEKLLLGIDAFEIGTNYPSYSDYILKGAPVTGINIEINPGIFYAAFAASNNQRGVENASFQRNLYAGRIGIGNKDDSHLIFTGLFAKDDENSIAVSPDNLTLTPMANYIFGAETKLDLFNKVLVFEGEGNASMLTHDTRDAALQIDAVPNFIKEIVTPKISSSFDYSYAAKISFNNPGSATRVSINTKMVGPGYTSLGSADLRSDQLYYEANVEQGLLSRKISIATFFRTSHDNLIEWKSSTTTLTAYGINLRLNFPKFPFLQISYSPYAQKNDNPFPDQKIENKTTMISAVAGYNLLIKEFNFSTNVSYTGYDAKTLTGLSDYKTSTVSITEIISFNNPLSFAGTWGIINTNSTSLYSTINSFDVSVNAAYTEFLSNTLGLNIATENSINKKMGIYFNTTYSPLKNINLVASIEGTEYKDLVDVTSNYNELTFNIILNVGW